MEHFHKIHILYSVEISTLGLASENPQQTRARSRPHYTFLIKTTQITRVFRFKSRFSHVWIIMHEWDVYPVYENLQSFRVLLVQKRHSLNVKLVEKYIGIFLSPFSFTFLIPTITNFYLSFFML